MAGHSYKPLYPTRAPRKVKRPSGPPRKPGDASPWVRIERDPKLRAPGMKFYVRTHRVHHGFTGCVFTAIGLALALHDRRDWRRWLKDLVKEL